MRFTRIRVARFGPLAGLDTGEDRTLPALVAVLGPNEAGKSAFHQVLHSLIHGFYPANRDQNPFTPWSGGDIEISADLLLDEGDRWEVHRRLLSTPRGQLVREAATETLDNRSLPCASHVDERIFSQVYAITLADLARVHEAAWEAVQDELIVGMGSRDFRPPREVIRELCAQADGLWRPDRRGRPRHRELRADLRDLRARRTEAERRDRDLREVEARSRELAAREEELRSRRTAAVEKLERLRDLLPLRNRLARLDELEVKVGEAVQLEGLPRDPAARLRELEDRVRRARVEREELAELESRLREATGALADPGPAAGDLGAFGDAFLALPLDRLRERVSALEEERRRHDDLGERLGGVESRDFPSSPRLPAWVVGALGLGGVLIVWAVLAGAAIPGVTGFLLFVLGGAAVARHRLDVARVEGETEAARRETEELRGRMAEAERRVDRRRSSVAELLEPLGLRESAVSRPSSVLVTELERLIGLLRDREARLRAREAAGADAEAAEAALAEFVRRLERAGGSADPEGLDVVERRLRDLEHLERFREELIGDAGDLETLRDRIRKLERAEEGWDRDSDRIAHEMAGLDGMDRELQELGKEAGELEGRAQGLAGEETVDLVDGRILELEEELREVARERDRRFVLARLLECAEARFRAEHQPDLLRRAEGHLAAFTRGRYSRILLDGEEGPEGLRLHADHLPGPLPVTAPLSTGTCEQVYVALRLAIVDHLDEGRETLPLLLDEVFVNWDPDRRKSALDVLRRVSEHRQVFAFTCHPHLAEEITERGGEVITLGKPVTAHATGG